MLSFRHDGSFIGYPSQIPCSQCIAYHIAKVCGSRGVTSKLSLHSLCTLAMHVSQVAGESYAPADLEAEAFWQIAESKSSNFNGAMCAE